MMNRPQAPLLPTPPLPALMAPVLNPRQIWLPLPADQRQKVFQELTQACRLLAKQGIEREVLHER